jgi:hypothetical protein
MDIGLGSRVRLAGPGEAYPVWKGPPPPPYPPYIYVEPWDVGVVVGIDGIYYGVDFQKCPFVVAVPLTHLVAA